MPENRDTPGPPSIRERIAALHMPRTSAPDFDPASAPDDPFALLEQWLIEAIDGGVVAPHAMTLATSSVRGGAAARTVLLQDIADARLRFATSTDSDKGRDLDADPRAAVVLHWREQHRQVRVTGVTLPGPRELSDADFLARSATARAGILAGRQSEPMPDPKSAQHLVAGARELIAVNPLFVPPTWSVYLLAPETVEFWQGPPGGQQQRLRFASDGRDWRREQLWP